MRGIILNENGWALMNEIIAEELCFADEEKRKLLVKMFSVCDFNPAIITEIEDKIKSCLNALFEKVYINKFRRPLIPWVCKNAPRVSSFEEIDLDLDRLASLRKSSMCLRYELEKHEKECCFCKQALSIIS